MHIQEYLAQAQGVFLLFLIIGAYGLWGIAAWYFKLYRYRRLLRNGACLPGTVKIMFERPPLSHMGGKSRPPFVIGYSFVRPGESLPILRESSTGVKSVWEEYHEGQEIEVLYDPASGRSEIAAFVAASLQGKTQYFPRAWIYCMAGIAAYLIQYVR
jgi:hypothetical protein